MRGILILIGVALAADHAYVADHCVCLASGIGIDVASPSVPMSPP